MFITFEGLDGSGKTTHIQAVAASLLDAGYDVLMTREPGGTPLGDSVRALLLASIEGGINAYAELFLFSAARVQHITDVVVPHLKSGGVVLCDRYTDSTIAYQSYGHGVPLSTVTNLVKDATLGVSPHQTFWLDIDPEISLERVRARKENNRLDSQNLAFLKRVRDGYANICAAEPHRVVHINANAPLSVVQRRVMQNLDLARVF